MAIIVCFIFHLSYVSWLECSVSFSASSVGDCKKGAEFLRLIHERYGYEIRYRWGREELARSRRFGLTYLLLLITVSISTTCFKFQPTRS